MDNNRKGIKANATVDFLFTNSLISNSRRTRIFIQNGLSLNESKKLMDNHENWVVPSCYIVFSKR
jgi:hypothetical protein